MNGERERAIHDGNFHSTEFYTTQSGCTLSETAAAAVEQARAAADLFQFDSLSSRAAAGISFGKCFSGVAFAFIYHVRRRRRWQQQHHARNSGAPKPARRIRRVKKEAKSRLFGAGSERARNTFGTSVAERGKNNLQVTSKYDKFQTMFTAAAATTFRINRAFPVALSLCLALTSFALRGPIMNGRTPTRPQVKHKRWNNQMNGVLQTGGVGGLTYWEAQTCPQNRSGD